MTKGLSVAGTLLPNFEKDKHRMRFYVRRHKLKGHIASRQGPRLGYEDVVSTSRFIFDVSITPFSVVDTDTWKSS